MSFLAKVRGKAWLKWIGYVCFFDLVFYGSLYLTFPYDALRDRITSEARDRLGLELRIDKVRLAGISGIKLSGVELITDAAKAEPSAAEIVRRAEARKAAEERGEPEPEVVEAAPEGIRIDSITAKAGLIAALRGKQAVSFDLDAWGGRIKGSVEQGKEHRAFQLQARNLDLEKSPMQHYSGLDLGGRLSSFDVSISSEGADFTKAEGQIQIKGEELLLRGGEVQNFELPAVALGALDGKIDIKEGKADTETFEITGPDLNARMQLTVRLAGQLSASTLSGKLQLKPSEDWWNRNEMLKTAANFALPEGEGGWRSINLYGQLQKPGFRP